MQGMKGNFKLRFFIAFLRKIRFIRLLSQEKYMGKVPSGVRWIGSTLGPFLGSMGPHEPIWTLYREKNSFFEWNNASFYVIPIDR